MLNSNISISQISKKSEKNHIQRGACKEETQKKPQKTTEVHERTLKLGDVFEDPNDSVGAEETTNLASAAT